MRLEMDIDVDPKLIRINHRYTNIRKVPPEITKAMHRITRSVSEYCEQHDIAFDREARLAVTLTYTMNDRMADVDGPGKRALDAIAKGINIIDGHVDDFRQIRGPIGEPGIHVLVETLDHHEKPDIVPLDDEWGVMAGENVVRFRS